MQAGSLCGARIGHAAYFDGLRRFLCKYALERSGQ